MTTPVNQSDIDSPIANRGMLPFTDLVDEHQCQGFFKFTGLHVASFFTRRERFANRHLCGLAVCPFQEAPWCMSPFVPRSCSAEKLLLYNVVVMRIHLARVCQQVRGFGRNLGRIIAGCMFFVFLSAIMFYFFYCGRRWPALVCR
ncbi:unnamed protein product [Ectocarpus sp. 4 AP-2014]